ncbi:DUF362 domain-containing protein [Candidatus Heimdallarchaeota archaeon]|nr:MAG: DUF362 domain-containing protein [Candidatus Heimdallarchaeota archaeon]
MKDKVCPKSSQKYLDLTSTKPIWMKLRENILILGILSLFWFLFRTGKKPTRIVYPCQQAALNSVTISATSIFASLSLSIILVKMRKLSSIGKIFVVSVLVLSPITTAVIMQTTASTLEINLPISSQLTSEEPLADIYLVNGREVAHIANLIDLMGDNNLSFYKSDILANNTSVEGLIASDDVVLIKNNCQWPQRGGTNTDLIKELIEVILNHPGGFVGEIVIADNGQGRGSMNWDQSNAEIKSQSIREVVKMFSNEYNVSAYLWDNIRYNEVEEYIDGNMNDGYVKNSTADAQTEICVTYPKFESDFGTKISFKNGIWNGTHYQKKLKVINMPVLKSHSGFGVTASMKHYMGVQSQPLGNGHDNIDTGGMATLMVQLGLPVLNILDAIWINANPENSLAEGPDTNYNQATRINIIMASLDPIALDYWAAEHILLNISKIAGYENPYSLDPDSTNSEGLTEAFGVWLNNSKEEFLREGFNFTTDVNHMNIYANSDILDVEVLGEDYTVWIIVGSIGSGVILGLTITVIILKRKGLLWFKKKL